MQGKISDLIDVGAIQKQIDDTTKALGILSKQTDEIAKKMKSMFDAVGNASSMKELLKQTKEYNEAVKSTSKTLTEQEKLEKQLIQLKEKLAAADSATNKEILAAREALRLKNNELKQEQNLNQAAAGSLDKLRAKLSLLTKQYTAMGAEQRKSAEGVELKNSIKGISDELKVAEGGIGDFRRNVGEYENAIKNALPINRGFAGSFIAIGQNSGGAIGALKGIGAALTSLAKNQFIIAAAAIVGLFKAMANAVKENEERSNQLKTALAPLNAVMEQIKKVIDVVTGGFIVLVGWIGKAVDALLEFSGIDTKANEFVAMEKLKQEAIKSTRELTVEEAKISREVSELKNKAAQKDKYTAKERIKFNEDAIAKEEKLSELRLKNANMQLQALRAESALTKDNAEMKDKLAQAEANVENAKASAAESTIRLQQRRATLEQEIYNDERARLVLILKLQKDRLESAQQVAAADASAYESSKERNKRLLNDALKLAEFQAKIDKANVSKYDANYALKIKEIDEKLQKQRLDIANEYAEKLAQVEIGILQTKISTLREFETRYIDEQRKLLELEYTQAINAAKKKGEDVNLITAQYAEKKRVLEEKFVSATIARNEKQLGYDIQRYTDEFQAWKDNLIKKEGDNLTTQSKIRKAEAQHLQDMNNLQIDAIKEALKNENLSADQQEALNEKLNQFIRANNKITADEDKANDKELLERKTELNAQLIELGKEVASALFEFAKMQFEANIKRLEDEQKAQEKFFDEREAALDNAVMSDERRVAEEKKLKEERAEAEKQMQAKIMAEKQKAAKWEKAQALIQSVINTAMSIGATAATMGFPAAIPFIAIAAATGAIQTALIAAKQIPAYEKGGENVSGLGLWGEVRPEVAVDRKGNVMVAYEPTVTDFEPGTTIFPSIEKYLQSMKNSSNTSIDYEKLDSIFKKNKAEQNVTLDSRGLANLINSQGARTTYINRMLNV